MKKLCLAVLLSLVSTVAFAQGNSENAKDLHIKPPSPASSIVVNISSLGCQTTAGSNMFAVNAWSWGASNPVTIGSSGGGAGAGKPSLSSLNIQKRFDPCSPLLFGAVTTGKHFQTLTLTQEDSSGNVVLTATLNEVFVESWEVAGSTSDALPIESVSFAFAKICIADTASGAKVCYDAVQGKGL